jgi:hypothetical protein
MILMKTKTLLMTAVMLLCFSAVASAQAIYSVSSTPVTTVISTGNAELSGSITFTTTPGTAVAGTITIYYGGANITTPFSSITITGGGVTVNTTASAYSPGSLVLSIAAGAGTFTVSNVRVQVSGTGLSKLDATISATGNQIAAGSTTVTLINSTTGVGIASVASYKDAAPITLSTASTLGLPSINAVSGAFDVSSNTNTTIVVKEGFLAAFTSQVGVRVTVSATPPKGVTFTFPATANSYSYDAAGTAPTLMHNWIRGTSTVATGAGTAQTISYTSTTSSLLQVNYYVATDASGTSDTAIEYLEIPVTAASDPTIETFPLAAKQFTYTVSLAPVLGAYTSSGTPYSSPAPRFTASESSAANLAAITGRTSALLIPFASTLSGFDTALSISNTTYDPGATLLGVATAAAPQSGTVTFYFFPQKTAAYTYSSYTTAAGSPGTGLDSSGNIISGGTYTVFVSQLAPLATPALTSFSGYIIAVTNFTNAQGIFVISNFTNLSVQSGMMGVISDRSVLPEKIF